MPFTRYQKAPRELREAKTKVWWDIKSCPVPQGYDPLLVRRSIESVLYKRKYHGPLTIIAFGNLEDIAVEVLRAYSDTGIVMKHDPFFESACADILGCTSSISTIMKEMRNWKYVGGSMGDRDIFSAYDYDPDFKPPNFTWKDLLEDAKIDCAGKSIEDTGEPGGGIFCAVCITYCAGGTRVEDAVLTVEHSLSSLSSCAYTSMIYKTIPSSLALRGQQAPIFVASSHVSDPELVVQEVNQCMTVGDATRNVRKTDNDRFGKHAIGGRDGKIYMVTDPRDKDAVNPKPGTLRHAVIQEEPLWIIFSRDMIIKLKEELIMNSFKTIDGRGASVHIAGGACIYSPVRDPMHPDFSFTMSFGHKFLSWGHTLIFLL
ncbi:hypothetical protein F2Q68_00045432 [Brassica cretica]|uniref:NYN domain-containing protein n=1 Tax=Brassica cretica TaxID=69181 RepID=A0A8S9LNR4_BRACR|nr:hypothetical protein F2Q68_00045432 [Brassica cretica]